jgi:glycosyltransferase involved in cell wall biosynthesis
MLERAFERAHEFDVIHAHLDYLAFPIASRPLRRSGRDHAARAPRPAVARARRARVRRAARDRESPMLSCRQLPDANWIRYGACATASARPVPGSGDGAGGYLAFVGGSPVEKRVDRAIEIAIGAGVPLRIAAKVDPNDAEYFHARIEPLLDHPLVEYVGELDDANKNAFIGDAAALVFPIDWPEPFGLAMIEALACGTPVIAWPHGSVREVVRNGVSGWIVEDVDAAVRAVGSLDRVDRRQCRAEFEARFTSERMASEYVEIYARAVSSHAPRSDEPGERCSA